MLYWGTFWLLCVIAVTLSDWVCWRESRQWLSTGFSAHTMIDWQCSLLIVPWCLWYIQVETDSSLTEQSMHIANIGKMIEVRTVYQWMNLFWPLLSVVYWLSPSYCVISWFSVLPKSKSGHDDNNNLSIFKHFCHLCGNFLQVCAVGNNLLGASRKPGHTRHG